VRVSDPENVFHNQKGTDTMKRPAFPCRRHTPAWGALALLLCAAPSRAANDAAAAPAARPAGGAFGVCNSAEGSGDYPRLLPLLREAGVSTIRGFPEWAVLQPQRGQWNFAPADALVKDARENGIEIMAPLAYLAPWASADGGTRTFPIKNMQDWRDYVAGVVARYHADIKYWEVYNEFQGFSRNGTPKDYAAMVRDAYDTAKKIDPEAKIGLGTSSVDVSFLEQAINAGAADHFDWIDIHPYELMGAVTGDNEPVFLQIVTNVRKMLVKTKQRVDTPIWVGEIGIPTSGKAEDDRQQAAALVKAYVLCLAQGVERVYWFEGRGPYHMGLIRNDAAWTRQPAYFALQTMTRLLGPNPERIGWYNPTGKSYGFVFQGAQGPVLVIWAAGAAGDSVSFGGGVSTVTLDGQTATLKEGQPLALTRAPLFVTGLPSGLVAAAAANGKQGFPWVKDFSRTEAVTCIMGAANAETGLMLHDGGDGKTVLQLMEDGSYARRTDKAHGAEYMYFDVDDSYAGVGDNDIEITVTGRAANPAVGATCNLTYESARGYRDTAEFWKVPADAAWHAHTFRLNDANFGNNWGWNFRLRICGSPGDLLVKQVTVKRIGAKK
jgi:hypothetical protein